MRWVSMTTRALRYWWILPTLAIGWFGARLLFAAYDRAHTPEAEALREWTEIVRDPPRPVVTTFQLRACRKPPKGARTEDLARCRNVLAPAEFQVVREWMTRGQGFDCMAARDA